MAPPRSDRKPLWPLALLALFAAAAASRWAYLARLGATPFAHSLDADSRIYWDWSEFILRHGPVPPAPFYLAPLYPYALAGLRALGAGMAQVLAIQALLGAAAVALLADATRRIAGWRAGLAVGCILALLQPATFFDGLVLPESLLFFLESLLVWLVARADWSGEGLARYAAYGLLAGALAQGRASNAVLLALAVPLAWARRAPAPRRIAAAALAIAAFGACGVPALLANRGASGETIPFTYNAGYNLYVGNNPDADGTWVDVTAGSIPVPLSGTPPTTGGALDGRAFVLATTGRRLSPAESSAWWAAKALAFVRAHPARALGLAGRKLLLGFRRREIPQIESMASFARAAGPLGAPLLGSFGLVAVLGLAGVAWAARGGPRERWLVGYVLAVSLAMAPFFVTDRYRHHLLPALAVLGGIALEGIARAARAGAGAALARPAAAIGLAAAIVFAPVGPRPERSGAWVALADRAIKLGERGAWADAAAEFARAEAALGPVEARALPLSARVDLAAFHFRYAVALAALGRDGEAIARWERAVLLNPNDASSLGRLSVAYDLAGRGADAERARRRLAPIPGGRAQLLLDDGWTAAGRGDLAGAERMFLAAIEEAPDLSAAWSGLIRLRIQTGRIDDASGALDRARGAGLDLTSADIFECFIATQRGDLVRARRILDRIPAGAATADPFLTRLLNLSRRAVGR
ncbi:MAG TPA: tetratricopeptide repeat protein [Candidatus Eisenbacteria bacterium]